MINVYEKHEFYPDPKIDTDLLWTLLAASSILAVPPNLKNQGKILPNKQIFNNLFAIYIYNYIDTLPGDYCEGVIPDPIPNSEVKPFSADGTLS